MTSTPNPDALKAFIAALIAKSPAPTARKRAPTTKPAPKAPTDVAPAQPIAPGAWRLSTRWTSEVLVAVAQTTICDNCHVAETSSQPFIYLQRFHPLFGIHREALSVHSPRHVGLPRKVEAIESRTMFCRHCFAGASAASMQYRLPFDLATPATFKADDGQIHLTDLFNALGASAPEGNHEVPPKAASCVAHEPIPFNRSITPVEVR